MDSIVSVAPLVGYSDRYFRKLARIFSPSCKVFSPMIVANNLKYCEPSKLLEHDVIGPQAVQLAGNDPLTMVAAAKLGEKFNYDEININIGCPSKRSSAGGFGACMMEQPEILHEILEALVQAVDIPITCKIRTGIGPTTNLDKLDRLLDVILMHTSTIYVHARNAVLKGFSTRQNRNIPQLQPELFKSLRKRFPSKTWIYNGGLDSLQSISDCLQWSDGVMLGRAIQNNIGYLADIESSIFNSRPDIDIIYQHIKKLLQEEEKNGVALWNYTRHLSTMVKGFQNASEYRRILSNHHILFSDAMKCIDKLFAVKYA